MKKLLAASILAAAPFAAFAGGTETDSFDITVNVLESCEITTFATNISVNYDHYNYDQQNPPSGSTSTQVECITGTTYTLEVDNTPIDSNSKTLTITLNGPNSTTLDGELTVSVAGASYTNGEFTANQVQQTITYDFEVPQVSDPSTIEVGQYSKTISVTLAY